MENVFDILFEFLALVIDLLDEFRSERLETDPRLIILASSVQVKEPGAYHHLVLKIEQLVVAKPQLRG